MKVQALINGRLVSTPKALAVFKKNAEKVNGRLGMVDAALGQGGLSTASALKALQDAFKEGHNLLDYSEVVYYYKAINWHLIQGPKWAIQSAEAFVDSCVQTCASIEFMEDK